jgi:hypothetical protein
MSAKRPADLTEILANDLKGLGGIQPLIFAVRFQGHGAVSQAYRNLFAARAKQARIFRRVHHRDLTFPVHWPSGSEGGDHFFGDRFAALERMAADSLSTIRNSDVT